MSTKYSIGQMNQLGDALELAGFTPDEVTKLRNYSHWDLLRRVVNGQLKVTFGAALIDCDANPFVPEGWKVKEHIKGGQFEWSPNTVQLYLSEKQKDGGVIEGNKLRKGLKSKPVLNANVLDYLLAHPCLIPEEWKGKYIFFWGTIYRSSDGFLYVRCLRWRGGGWNWNGYWLDDGFLGSDPAVLAM